ncbi:phosphonoacetaldehyde reductase [Helicobacter sp. 13S00477-4]|uniref:phosphonoacetaldehyde reductase n=1 Tax=Helicobacter sp. 13S00477-4 TaxID=1905759 RepID=UPI000BA66ED5|nr:phosphonoacetaldehyde reductase [Helicobacter sp. 13S00477-4]PAF51943.1 hypothetical protein BKH44_04585 [Helicobacter sp. 13S00477-4]
MNFNFYNPVEIVFNIPYTEALSKIDSKDILLITSAGFEKRGLIESSKKILGNKLKKIISNVPTNPCIKYLKSLQNITESIQSIIAIGGGSVIDCAKILSINSPFQIKDNVPTPEESKPFIPIYAFPTTAGTSSELTPWATIWDKENNKKYSLHLRNLYCKAAFYDPSLMLTLPKDITISTALDALSHSVESIWNKNANPISTNNATKAIELILENLPKLSKDLHSLYLREQITLASIFAGFAFGATQTALAHAISYPLTIKKGIPHGIACSFTLPFLFSQLPESQAKQTLKIYQTPIKKLFSKLNIPTDFKNYNISKEELKEILNSLNDRAKNSLFDIESIKNQLS